MYRDGRHTIPRKHSSSANWWQGEWFCLSPGHVCFEGNRRGGESDRSSLLFPFCRPKEGWTMEMRLADWKAAWERGRLSANYRWPMDKIRWLRGDVSVFWSGLDIACRFGFAFRGHFDSWMGPQSVAPWYAFKQFNWTTNFLSFCPNIS
jgi:hypothetical protein